MTDDLSEIHQTLAEPSPEFEAWVASMNSKLWARFDLSAARLGWEAARKSGDALVARGVQAVVDLIEQQRPTPTTHENREDRMVVVARKMDGTPDVWCDPEIADLVAALNNDGIRTVASCSGHGERPGNIALEDGRELIIATSYDEARQIEAAFPTVNGDSRDLNALATIAVKAAQDWWSAQPEYTRVTPEAHHQSMVEALKAVMGALNSLKGAHP